MKRSLSLGIALVLCLMLFGSTGLAEAFEGTEDIGGAEVAVEAVEAAVPEDDEFALSPEPADVMAAENSGAQPAEQAQPAAGEATPADPAQPTDGEAAPADPTQPADGETAPADPAQPAPAERLFTKTVDAGTETWQDVNLVRGEGFNGAFAKVDGKLTLSNALIEGAPAREADLGKCFQLEPGASVVIADDAPLRLSLSMLSFNKGAEKKLSLTWNGKALDAKKAKWKIASAKVAKLVKPGKLAAKKKGATTLTVSYKGETATCALVVTDIRQVTKVKLNASKKTIPLNGSGQLKAKVNPDDATYPQVTWKSSKPGVVSVDQKGRLTGLAVGKATITATSKNGKSDKCEVTVQEVKPKSLDFTKLYVTLHPGETRQLQVKFKPEDTSKQDVAYKTSDKSVATVDEDGVVTAVGVGSATITGVSAANGKVKNTCRVCVIEEGSKRMAGVIVGINPGHQIKTIMKQYPLAPGSHKTGKGVKTGACGRWTRVEEYDTNLQIGLKLRKLLEDEGATVVMTRTTNDVMLTNIDRAKMLNAAGVDVALQLHCNASSDTRKNGCSGYYRDNSDWVAESKALAKAITSGISESTGCFNKGIKVYNDYMSLNWTTTPSMLIEMGYLSNRNEDKLLATDAYRNKVAKGMLKGLHAYFDR